MIIFNSFFYVITRPGSKFLRNELVSSRPTYRDDASHPQMCPVPQKWEAAPEASAVVPKNAVNSG